MIRFKTKILQFAEQGEKTGWSYIQIPAKLAQELKPGNKVSFRVKGKLDAYAIRQVALLPMGEGDFIMPLKAEVRKALGKQKGATLDVSLAVDVTEVKLPADLLECLSDEPAALAFFQSLPRSHQLYFGKWIDSAKTVGTRTKRIAQCVNALARSRNYGEMIRALKEEKDRGKDF